MRSNVRPGLVLQACALLVVLGYALVPSFHAALDEIGALKSQYGYAYSAVSTALFGGFIPYVVLYFSGKVPRDRAVVDLVFYVGFWFWKGFEIDALYRLQSIAFGSDATIWTVVPKVLVDQFVYNPLWAAPTQVIFFLWKDCRYSREGTIAQLNVIPLWHRTLVILLSTWIVWLPTVAIVYSLPQALQLPLSNLVLCFWCLLLSFVSRTSQDATSNA